MALCIHLQSAAVNLINMQRQTIPRRRWITCTIQPALANEPATGDDAIFIQEQILGKAPLSLVDLEQAFDRIANDSRPKGVLLYIRGFAMSLADLQSLRDTILTLASAG